MMLLLSPLHAIAARRGEGLRPELVRLLERPKPQVSEASSDGARCGTTDRATRADAGGLVAGSVVVTSAWPRADMERANGARDDPTGELASGSVAAPPTKICDD